MNFKRCVARGNVQWPAPGRRRLSALACLAGVGACLLAGVHAGCRKPVHFPAQPLAGAASAPGVHRAYDTDRDGKADFFLLADASGRAGALGYDHDADGKIDAVVDLDAVKPPHCRHLVIILDGIGYPLVKKYYDAGNLRVFHPPRRVISPYPSMTDPSLEDALGYMPCEAFEAKYFDRRANRLAGGAGAYLAGKNAPYNRLLQYRAGMIWDAIGYVKPWAVFGKEVNDAKRLFDKGRTQEFLAYFVSSAGVGTKSGPEGQRRCLARIEQLVLQVLCETRGLTKVTLLADHGHSGTPARRIGLDKHLKSKGWRLTDRLSGAKDVVCPAFGLVTFASFSTNEPAALARDLVACKGVELASYVDKDAVVVLAPGQMAMVRRKAGRFRYEPIAGDPLRLKGILAKMPAAPDGYHGAGALVRATATHAYPAPLQRLWRAHFTLVRNPPDVIASLADEFYHGTGSFAGAVNVASTHGGLNYRNSVTFIMSTAGPLPPVMQSKDIPANMRKLMGAPWPAGK